MRFALPIFVCLLLVLLAVPAMAGSLSVVPKGGDVFIGEQGLDISACLATGTVNNTTTYASQIAYFNPGDNPQTAAPAATLTVQPTGFYVAPSNFHDRTGNWYQYPVSGSAQVAFIAREPTVTISARDSNDNDLSSKSVSSGSYVTFRVESNTYNIPAERGTTAGFATIKVQSPDGTVYNALYQSTVTPISLEALSINASPFYWMPYGATSGWNTGFRDTTGSKIYKAGNYTYWVEINGLNGMKENYNPGSGVTVSAKSSLVISSDTLKIDRSTEQVVKGNPFSVSITGPSKAVCSLYVKNTNTNDVPPSIVLNQDGVSVVNSTFATVTLSDSGTRTVGFRTTQDTKDKVWTIKVESGSKSDEVDVRVLKGQVTIASAGSNNYYMGDEIKFAGSNTETDTTYLFITGPNLPSSGGQLNDPRKAVVDGNANTFATSDVESDYTWTYKWQTENISIDAGTYTIYAVATPHNRDNLGNTQYATTSVTIRKPYITAYAPSIVATGDKIVIYGNAGSSPSAGIATWIMGKNFVWYKTASVETNGSYSVEVSAGDTANMFPGQYFVVVQNPMYNGQFDVWPNADETTVLGRYPVDGNLLFRIQGPGSLQGSDAADALTEALKNPAVDDVYARLQFNVENDKIIIEPIGEKQIGDSFTVNGLTNLAAGTKVQISVVSSSFKPQSKETSSEFSGVSGEAVIESSNATMNKFTFKASTEKFKPDEYIVNVVSDQTSAYGSTLFTVKEYIAPTPTPTPVPTTPTPTPVPIVTTPTPTPLPPTTVPTTVPTTKAAPGFGIVIALIGLAGVAFLVVRKDH